MPHENLNLPLRDINRHSVQNRFMAKQTDKENKVGPVIERRLRELGKTQHWLAEKLGLSDVSVHNWIQKGTIARDNIVPAAMALGVTTAQLMGETKEEVKVHPETPAKASLQWVMPDEELLLEHYRLCTDIGKEMALRFIEVAPKKDSSESKPGRRLAA
jgi:plasmid maintenance system antidote protein VapI